MIDCFLALGSNLGPSYELLCDAIRLIGSIKEISFIASSRPFLTQPVSPLPQNSFLNAAVHIRTTLDPLALFAKLEAIERQLGKQKKEKWQPRLIDIDLIFYGTEQWQGQSLTIPHPHWRERLFVLYPLADLVDLTFPPCEKVVAYEKNLPYQRKR